MPASPHTGLLMVACEHDPVGVGRQIELAAAAFQAAGWQVTVAVLSSGGSLADRLGKAGTAVVRLSRRPRPDASAAFRLLATLQRERPVVVLGWGRETACPLAVARQCWRAAGLPPYRTLLRLDQPPQGWLETAAVAAADRLLVTAESVADRCRRSQAPGQIQLVPPAAAPFADVSNRERLATQLGLDPAKPWTLCVAPLVAESRLERLLWGIDQMGVARQDLEHILVGSGRLKPRLLRRARVEEIDGWLHWFDHLPCLPELLPQIQLVLQPGSVAYGGCLPEALAHGLPVVAVTSPESRDLLGDEGAGRLVPPVPESELARRAIQMLEDREQADACATAARTRAATVFAVQPALAALVEAVEAV